MDGRILFLPGDGVGPEILREARRVLEAIEELYGHRFDIIEGSMGAEAIERFGTPLPEETRKLAVSVDAVLLGAVGFAVQPVNGTTVDPAKGLLELRELLGNYANLRPIAVPDTVVGTSPFRADHVRGVDLVIVREALGGIYYGRPRGIENGVAYDTEIYTEAEIRRIAESAFELARTRRRKVTSIDKANVLASSVLWRRITGEVAGQYADIEFGSMFVDNCAMQLISNPRQFDVVLTNNMFGDILSDEAAVLCGSLGMLPSASVGGDVGLYEPVHGTAPDIAGKGLANPVGAILSVAMMLDLTFALPEEANAIGDAVARVLRDGYATADLWAAGGRAPVSTAEMGTLVVGALGTPKRAKREQRC
ncbi:3-isopropylmalate dehydrogenase [Candidatus Palauibacter sp.]|uniref:3-isopropylmalate dehydrogenase n=1 Tax=Candidatus Palauibacter sp. TaxID=3101350 RepID=UPI003B5C1FEB